MALLKGTLLRGSISPRVPLILTPVSQAVCSMSASFSEHFLSFRVVLRNKKLVDFEL